HAVVLKPDTPPRQWRLVQLSFCETSADTLEPLATKIRSRLTEVFEHMSKVVKDRPVYVTLSGGLDSTIIAMLAREYLRDITAITFSVDTGSGKKSEDLVSAERVAEELGIPLFVIRETPHGIVDLLDLVLVCGQDWRDFNVHCALVNAVLGRAIRDHH